MLTTRNIGDRIKQLRRESHLSQVELAGEMGLSQSILSQIENDQITVSVDLLVKISRRFKVGSEWLIHGDEIYFQMLLEDSFMPMLDSEVIAGYVKDPSYSGILKNLQMYKIPGFVQGDYRIFPVDGDSMVPTLSAEDQVVCSRVNNPDQIAEGTLVVIVTDKDALVKRIYRSTENQDAFLVKSDNEEFKMYSLPKSNIGEIWQVEAKITRSFIDSSFAHVTRIDTLEKDIEGMKDQMKELLEEVRAIKGREK